jgi:hypothetical protein
LDFYNDLPEDMKKRNIHLEIESYLEKRNKKNFYNISSNELSLDSEINDDDDEDDEEEEDSENEALYSGTLSEKSVDEHSDNSY